MARSIYDTGLWVKRLQAQHHRDADTALAVIDITLVQWDALRHLSENPGASLHALAQLTFQTDQSFGALASRLESRGFVRRLPAPGRAVRHELTAKGLEVEERGRELLGHVLAESFGPLSADELATLDGMLQRLVR